MATGIQTAPDSDSDIIKMDPMRQPHLGRVHLMSLATMGVSEALPSTQLLLIKVPLSATAYLIIPNIWLGAFIHSHLTKS